MSGAFQLIVNGLFIDLFQVNACRTYFFFHKQSEISKWKIHKVVDLIHMTWSSFPYLYLILCVFFLFSECVCVVVRKVFFEILIFVLFPNIDWPQEKSYLRKIGIGSFRIHNTEIWKFPRTSKIRFFR